MAQLAYASRYSSTSVAELLAMTRTDFELYLEALSDIVRRENGSGT
jgi:hypothetical protein